MKLTKCEKDIVTDQLNFRDNNTMLRLKYPDGGGQLLEKDTLKNTNLLQNILERWLYQWLNSSVLIDDKAPE